MSGDVLDPSDLSKMLHAGPYTITANALTGYRFVRWIDENGNEVSTNPALVIARDAITGRYEAHTYRAVFAELEDVTINYVVSDSATVWIDFASDSVAPVSGTPKTNVAHVSTGYMIDGWYDAAATSSGSADSFTPARGADGLYVAATYTLRIIPKTDTPFVIEYWLQDATGRFQQG